MIRILFCTACLVSLPLAALAQMTPDQRVLDFSNLAALYAKRYGPYEWKKIALGVDAMNTAPWIERVRKAKDDLEFYEICSEYVANLEDTHSSFRIPSNFVADLGFYVDIYDGRVLVESLTAGTIGKYGITWGDEVISIDGKPVEQLIEELARLRKRGNPVATRRSVADLLTYRPQTVIPRAVELADTAKIVLRRGTGEEFEAEVPWMKSGYPVMSVGPVYELLNARRGAAVAPADPLQLLNEMHNWSLSPDDHLLQGEIWSEEEGQMVPRRYLMGIGSRSPSHIMPVGFQQRLGRLPTEFHFSGTYESEGYRIGYLRIPTFSPSIAIAINELNTEVGYFEKNTDGLVVDVRRNPGGGCYMLDVARRLIPTPFYFFGEQYRATLSWISSLQSSITYAKSQRADSWVIDLYQVYLDEMIAAYKQNRGMTGVIPSCYASDGPFVAPVLENYPAPIVYTKPIIFLIDEFSTSAADIFPAMMQDNRRGPMVGARSNGAGGVSGLWSTGTFSESSSSYAASLVVRKGPIVTPEYPAAPYVENIGVRPDIPLEFMTRENLMNGGRPFVEAFTRIMVDEIRKAKN